MTAADMSSLVVAVCHADGRQATDAWGALCDAHGGPTGVIDWMQTGSQQRLLPLLGTRDRVLALPPEVTEACDRATAAAWGLNIRLINEITPVVLAWKNEGIHPLLIKGLGLVGDVYHDHQLRPIGDADMLIRRNDLDTAVGVMAGLGWNVPRSRVLHFRGGGTAVNFAHDTGISIDLHLRPSRNVPIRRDDQLAAWNEPEALPTSHPLAGLGVRRPSSVQHAVTLIAHIARPSNAHLAHPLVDLHRLFVRRADLQTPTAAEALIDAVRYEGMAIRAATVLTELRTTLNTPLPLDPTTITPATNAAELDERAAIAAETRLADSTTRRRIRDLALVSTTGMPASTRAKVYAGLVLRRTIARLD